jgi:hypothetical protein
VPPEVVPVLMSTDTLANTSVEVMLPWQSDEIPHQLPHRLERVSLPAARKDDVKVVRYPVQLITKSI